MVEHKNMTIMFTDIKGFTERSARQSRVETVVLIDQHEKLLAPLIESRGGRVVKTIGDSFMAVFHSPTDALLAGADVQQALTEHNRGRAANDGINVRIAINTGEVSLRDGDVFGEAVNIAARLEKVARPGDTYFTEATYLAMNKSEVIADEIGSRVFKGIPDPVRIFRVGSHALRRRKFIRECAFLLVACAIGGAIPSFIDFVATWFGPISGSAAQATNFYLMVVVYFVAGFVLGFFSPRKPWRWALGLLCTPIVITSLRPTVTAIAGSGALFLLGVVPIIFFTYIGKICRDRLSRHGLLPLVG